MPIFTGVVDITVLQGTKMQMVQSFLVNLQREDTFPGKRSDSCATADINHTFIHPLLSFSEDAAFLFVL